MTLIVTIILGFGRKYGRNAENKSGCDKSKFFESLLLAGLSDELRSAVFQIYEAGVN